MQRRDFIVGLVAAITGSIHTNAQELQLPPLVGHLASVAAARTT